MRFLPFVIKKVIENIFSSKPANDWVYFNFISRPEIWDYPTNYYNYRFCKNTGELQENVTHCLGLNPPKYVANWCKLNAKPKFSKDSDGNWRIKELITISETV